MKKKNSIYFLYNYFFIPILSAILPLLAKYKKNIKKYLDVRKKDDFVKRLITFKKSCNNERIIWFHSSSLGEYEQAKPIINLIKNNYQIKAKIVISFFSASGYDYAKDSDNMYDLKFYLPFDSKKNANIIINILNPDFLFFLGYDVWYNILITMKENNKPAYLINATIKEKSLRINKYLKPIFKSLYSDLNKIFAVSESMKKRYSQIYNEKNIIVTGDSRFDNVVERKQKVKTNNLHKIFEHKFIIIIGSSHSEDEKIIIPALKFLFDKIPESLIIFAPHKVSNNKINTLIQNFSDEKINYLKYSVFEQNKIYNNESIIIIDSIGKLFDLYSLGNCAYIGGSFKEGVHNIMEPAVFELPIIVGPVYKNSNEAVELKEKGLLNIIQNTTEFFETILKIYETDEKNKKNEQEKITEYIKSKTGVADFIFNEIVNK
jgi:3-deoxy-D-manno-octulosonic-acid transferase